MVRTHIKVLLALLTLVSANIASAFGLGELTLKSYLNQPLEAEIEILDVGDLTQDEIIPKLAAAKDFANLGVQRSFFLNQLKFKVVFEKDRNYVQVVSSEPVTEPFLDFIVEFLWPEGRLLREYTLLLDPPSYAAQFEEKIQPVVVAEETNPAEPVVAEPAVVEEAAAQEPQAVVQEPATVSPESYRTVTNQDNETLWGIASRERPVETVSVQQTMLAIQALNPDAFEHNNINYLKKNQVLRMPSEQEIRALATREALGLVADQNREWAGRTAANGGTLPMDTAKLVGSRQVSPIENDASVGDQMKLVADTEEGVAAAGYGEGSASSDEVARIQRHNSQLAQDRDRLKSQVETSERLLSLKDQEIAKLQAMLAEQGVQTETSAPVESLQTKTLESVDEVVESPEVETKVAFDDASNAAAETQALSEEDEIAAAMAEAMSDAESYEDTAASDSSGDEMVFEADPESQKQLDTAGADSPNSAAGDTFDRSKLASTPAPQESSSDGLMGLLPLIGGGIAILLIGGLGFFLYKKRVSNSDQSGEVEFTGADLDGDDGFEGLGGIDEVDGLSDDAFGGVEDASQEDSTQGSETLLTEADTYISFNRHAQAVDLLKAAIADGNNDTAVKLKLLEAYQGAGDLAAFEALKEEVLAEDPSQASAIDALGQGGDAPANVEAEEEFDMDATTRMDASDFDLDSGEDEFDISLDDLASDLDANFDSSSDNTAVEEELADTVTLDVGDIDMGDGDASSDDDLMSDTVVEEPAAEEDGLDLGDLDLDLGSSDDDALDLDDLNFDDDASESEAGDLDLDLGGLDDTGSDDELSLDLDEGDESGTLIMEPSEDSSEALDLDLDSDEGLGDLDSELDLDLGDGDDSGELDLDLGDSDLDLDGSGDDELDLDADLDLDGALDGDADLDLEADLGGDDELELDADEDLAGDLDLSADLELDSAEGEDSLDLGDDLDLGDLEADSGDELDLGDLEADAGDELDLSADDDLNLDDDLSLEAEMDDDLDLDADLNLAGGDDDSLFGEGGDDDFDLSDEANEASTKLDLARAYIDMGDEEGAKDILEEVMAEGDDSQKADAKTLLDKL